MLNNIVFITSVINFDKNKALSYSKVRSIYTTTDRIHQTLNSIKSVKKYIPDARVILLELGKSDQGLETLKSSSDRFVYLGNNRLVRMAVDSKYKGLGEAIGLLVARKYIHEENIRSYFKLSGRYILNNKFDYKQWLKSVPNEKMMAKIYGDTISTRFYGFGGNFWSLWIKALIWSVPKLLIGKSIEQSLYQFYGTSIEEIKNIGVEGHVAVDGALISE